MPSKPNPWARRRARRALVQAVYQWQMTECDVAELERQFREDGSLAKADQDFFSDLLRGVARDSKAIDEAYVSLLDRSLKDLDQVERAIDVPYRVVIAEYVELAKTFGAEGSYKYINGILDQLAGQHRALERGDA